MEDALLTVLKKSVPDRTLQLLQTELKLLETGNFCKLLASPLVTALLGHESIKEFSCLSTLETNKNWCDTIFDRLESLLVKTAPSDSFEHVDFSYRQHYFVLVAYAALQAFLQSNVTGPPLDYTPALLFSNHIAGDANNLRETRATVLSSFKIDGEAPYRLAHNLELLALADMITTCPPIKKNVDVFQWLRVRVDFLHQRLLSEKSETLKYNILEGLTNTAALLERSTLWSTESERKRCVIEFQLEEAAVSLFHGDEKKARSNLQNATAARGFEYVLTGALGKRTRYQERDISQLVVLAKSQEADTKQNLPVDTLESSVAGSRPETLDLNDDTLLESVSFTKPQQNRGSTYGIGPVEQNLIPQALKELDPGDQPILGALDSIILLSFASSISNQSPADGLTREETLPYALRVLEGGSSNWQIYTQALLIRSRIEGYRARTIERGLLQLQALVDQIIAETTLEHAEDNSAGAPSISVTDDSNPKMVTTFLPRPKSSEAAPVQERLRYVHLLNAPTRWELESELAAKWVNLGGIRTALEIYERLEMWAEVALCWAAANEERKARKTVRRQLYEASDGGEVLAESERWEGPLRAPLPADAARLFCILGDLDDDPTLYEQAWRVSNQRYARAQRSLGKYYLGKKDFENAVQAYDKALKTNPQNHGSWFTKGCALLELSRFEEAADAFTRTVQLEDTDAEAWSNLAVALLSKPSASGTEDGVENQRNKQQALKALKRAASLRYDNFRIWDNIITVAASVVPPAYPDIILAQKRVIELRGPNEGENCIDVTILELLVRNIAGRYSPPKENEAENDIGGHVRQPQGLPRLVIDLFDNHVIPLITNSSRLWRLVATLLLWRQDPGAALAAEEKAWRATLNTNKDYETGNEQHWKEVAQATNEVVDSYESGGALDWKFKARSAIRSVLSNARDAWEDSAEFDQLQQRLSDLKGS